MLAQTSKYPRRLGFVLPKRTEQAALSFHDELFWATKDKKSAPEALGRADYHLERLKVYNRLALQLRLHWFGQ